MGCGERDPRAMYTLNHKTQKNESKWKFNPSHGLRVTMFV